MSTKDWAALQENTTIKCYVAGEGEVRYKLTMRDNMDRWIALRLDKSDRPVKAIILDDMPAIFSKLEN